MTQACRRQRTGVERHGWAARRRWRAAPRGGERRRGPTAVGGNQEPPPAAALPRHSSPASAPPGYRGPFCSHFAWIEVEAVQHTYLSSGGASAGPDGCKQAFLHELTMPLSTAVRQDDARTFGIDVEDARPATVVAQRSPGVARARRAPHAPPRNFASHRRARPSPRGLHRSSPEKSVRGITLLPPARTLWGSLREVAVAGVGVRRREIVAAGLAEGCEQAHRLLWGEQPPTRPS